MLGGGAEAGAVHRAHDQGRGRLAAEHVAELGGLVEDLVEADAEEVDEHQLGHRPQAGGGGARRGADEGALGDRRVEHPVAAELRHQALGDAERSAPGVVLAGCAHAAGDVLAHDDHPRVALHLLAQRLVDRLPVGLLGHRCPRSVGGVDVGQEIGLGRRRRRLGARPAPASITLPGLAVDRVELRGLEQAGLGDPLAEQLQAVLLGLAAGRSRRARDRSSRRPRNGRSSGMSLTCSDARPLAVARPLDRLARRLVDLEEVVAVDLGARHAVGLAALDQVAARPTRCWPVTSA